MLSSVLWCMAHERFVSVVLILDYLLARWSEVNTLVRKNFRGCCQTVPIGCPVIATVFSCQCSLLCSHLIRCLVVCPNPTGSLAVTLALVGDTLCFQDVPVSKSLPIFSVPFLFRCHVSTLSPVVVVVQILHSLKVFNYFVVVVILKDNTFVDFIPNVIPSTTVIVMVDVHTFANAVLSVI